MSVVIINASSVSRLLDTTLHLALEITKLYKAVRTQKISHFLSGFKGTFIINVTFGIFSIKGGAFETCLWYVSLNYRCNRHNYGNAGRCAKAAVMFAGASLTFIISMRLNTGFQLESTIMIHFHLVKDMGCNYIGISGRRRKRYGAYSPFESILFCTVSIDKYRGRKALSMKQRKDLPL